MVFIIWLSTHFLLGEENHNRYISPTVYNDYLLYELLMAKNNKKEAFLYLKRALALDPISYYLNYKLAEHYYRESSKLDKAIYYLNRSLTLNRSFFPALKMYIKILEKEGKIEEIKREIISLLEEKKFDCELLEYVIGEYRDLIPEELLIEGAFYLLKGGKVCEGSLQFVKETFYKKRSLNLFIDIIEREGNRIEPFPIKTLLLELYYLTGQFDKFEQTFLRFFKGAKFPVSLLAEIYKIKKDPYKLSRLLSLDCNWDKESILSVVKAGVTLGMGQELIEFLASIKGDSKEIESLYYILNLWYDFKLRKDINLLEPLLEYITLPKESSLKELDDIILLDISSNIEYDKIYPLLYHPDYKAAYLARWDKLLELELLCNEKIGDFGYSGYLICINYFLDIGEFSKLTPFLTLLSQSFEPSLLSLSYYIKAELSINSKEYEKAKNYIIEGLSYYQSFPLLIASYITVVMAQGEIEKGEEECKKALYYELGSARVNMLCGRGLYIGGETKKAISYFKTALKLNPYRPLREKILKYLKGNF